MTKKVLYWILGVVGVCIVAAGVAYGVKYAMDDRTDKTSNEVATETKVEEDEVKQKLEKTDMTESAVIDMMHKMTHQKVKADQKWGAIPMSVENTTKVRDMIKGSTFSKKKELLEIAERWVQRDFSKVDQDHNYFWKVQGGTIGKATGVLSKQDELKFARRNYEDQIVQKLLEAGDLAEK